MKLTRTFFCTLNVIILGSFSFAVLNPLSGQASDFHSPRTASLAGAGHASPLLNDSIYLNPAYVSYLTNTVSVGSSYLRYESGDQNQDPTKPNSNGLATHGRSYLVSLQDGRSEVFQAGVGYAINEGGSSLHLGAAKSVVKRVGVGVGSKFFFNPTKQSLASEFSASTIVFPFQDMQIAVIVDNLFENSADRSRGLYREYLLGLKYNVMGILILYFDPHLVPALADASWGHESGVEFIVMKDLFLRAGFSRNAKVPYLTGINDHSFGTYGSSFGVGAGWISPKFSLDYAMARTLDPVFYTSHTLGMTMYF